MNTQSLKHQLSLQKWAGIVKARSQSGLKVIDFCHQEGISKDAYYYWLSQLRKEAIESVQTEQVEVAKLVKLVPPITTTCETLTSVHSQVDPAYTSVKECFIPQLLIQIGKASIAVNEHTSKELLSSVMEVLMHAE